MRADPESQILPRPMVCPTAMETGCKAKDFIERESERVLADYQVPHSCGIRHCVHSLPLADFLDDSGFCCYWPHAQPLSQKDSTG